MPAAPFWIEAFGGRPYRVERQKHLLPIDVPRLAVAAYGGTQPEKLSGLLAEADDGLFSRLAWAWPEPIPFQARAKATASRVGDQRTRSAATTGPCSSRRCREGARGPFM